jgi:TPR repeat protein
VLLLSGAAPAGFPEGLAAYERGDWAAALAEWRPLADAGLVEAQYNLGLLHHEGKGVPQDAARAHAWFLAAAKGGFARAQYRVAEMYEAGDGVERDLVQAHVWFTAAREQKYRDAKKRKRRVAKQMDEYEIAEAEMLTRERRRAAEDQGRGSGGAPVSRAAPGRSPGTRLR